MTIANFERFDLAPCSTIAFSRFKKHHTELNDIYWSFACSHAYTKKTTRGSSDADIPAQVLLLTGADTRRAPETMREWRTDFESFANWARLSMIMSASSYFEVYMREVFRLALQSDPLLVHGLSGELDGVILLKSGKRIDQSEAIDRCCKGEWNARASNIIKVFGSIPSDIQANLTELARIIHDGEGLSDGCGKKRAIHVANRCLSELRFGSALRHSRHERRYAASL